MAKPREIELGEGTAIPILYEDRAILAIDKPPGWMLAPAEWDRTGRNLQRALESSLAAGDYWARSRNLRFLRFVHRLDAETSGVLLLLKSRGALKAFSTLFEEREVEKTYLAVVHGVPAPSDWVCRYDIEPDPSAKGKMKAITTAKGQPHRHAKEAETAFHVIKSKAQTALVRARPLTGRTHQIRVHFAATGHPVLGDPLYGGGDPKHAGGPLALRAVALAYRDPFTKRRVYIEAPFAEFAQAFHFEVNRNELFGDAKRLKL